VEDSNKFAPVHAIRAYEGVVVVVVVLVVVVVVVVMVVL